MPVSEKAGTSITISSDSPFRSTISPTTVDQSEKTTSTTRPPIKVATEDTTPANGTIKGDMIYIIGFGLVENEGGGGEGTCDHEMKTNGNKIGCFG